MSLYAVTIFLSAFLLFQVQPLIARVILPWFGGSAAVWTVCMLFFQVLLLLGYLYSHSLVRYLRPQRQRMVHLAFLIASLALLPLAPSESWKPTGAENPTWRILGLLAASVGLPYFLLSTTGPLVQAWYARNQPGASPYRLFALSNFASMLALLSYPLLVEPYVQLRWQTAAWSVGFAVFVVLCATLAWRTGSATGAGHGASDAAADRPPLGLQLLWASLAGCASLLLLAFTSHMSLNVAAIPFLWVLPLSLYLLSFILCFEASGWYRRGFWLPLLALGLAGVCYTLIKDRNTNIWIQIPLYSATLFAACMACHGELARSKPHPRYLTGFYLMIALGGALGGVFIGLVAPAVFPDLYELPLGLVLVGLLVPAALLYDRSSALHGGGRWLARGAVGAATLALVAALAYEYSNDEDGTRTRSRNFYGVLKTRDAGEGDFRERVLTHGTIIHGRQFLSPERRLWPTSYYGPESGVGLAIRYNGEAGPIRVGVVGLGAGTLASYGRRGDDFRFYDIDRTVVHLANTEFSYLKDSQAHIDVVLGDARLSLEREPVQNFDVLALDAFSSDSIPVHLLTREAFGVYLRHLKPTGILAVHVSNRYLDLVPVVQEVARHFGLEARQVENQDDDGAGVYRSDWILLTRSAATFQRDALRAAEPIRAEFNVNLWTDDYSNLFRILKRL
jgi:SAM-dependent methyltransferase